MTTNTSNDGVTPEFHPITLRQAEALLRRAHDNDPGAKAELAELYETALAHERQVSDPASAELLTQQATLYADIHSSRRRATAFWRRLQQADVRSFVLREGFPLLKQFGVGALESFSPGDIEELAACVAQGNQIAAAGLRRLIREAELERESRIAMYGHLPDISSDSAFHFPGPEEKRAGERRTAERNVRFQMLVALKPLAAAYDLVAGARRGPFVA